MSSVSVSAGGAQTPQAPAQNTTPVAPAPLDPAIREFVAQELYKRYKLIRASMDSDNEPAKSKDASLQEDWESLPEHLKASTRAQADDIPRKLELTGYHMSKANDETKDGLQPVKKFTPEQLEYLGEVEHDRWVSERIKSGWQAAGKRDSSAQKTPFFTPYAELEQKWKDVDKFMVEGIFEILGLAGGNHGGRGCLTTDNEEELYGITCRHVLLPTKANVNPKDTVKSASIQIFLDNVDAIHGAISPGALKLKGVQPQCGYHGDTISSLQSRKEEAESRLKVVENKYDILGEPTPAASIKLWSSCIVDVEKQLSHISRFVRDFGEVVATLDIEFTLELKTVWIGVSFGSITTGFEREGVWKSLRAAPRLHPDTSDPLTSKKAPERPKNGASSALKDATSSFHLLATPVALFPIKVCKLWAL
ncbi:hypothetical protein TWF192_003470 [Orbilia oligospora]|uniref:Ryanodine receptor Ryr domain-containing protein n=1 Tax=Orbilia oligospora TaxID=2813651 RepID=A0A6G1MCX3_ORBOL|nr:hypothetical protein TWF191_008475 [Orbilia oligospora]KAF3253952.1 hypothetical protein TWF192_003470 [Orbilia oligospora]